MGSVSRLLGDLASAEELYQRALTIGETHYGPENPIIATSLNNLGLLYKELGDLLKSKTYLEKSLEICRAYFGQTHKKTVITKDNLNAVNLLIANK